VLQLSRHTSRARFAPRVIVEVPTRLAMRARRKWADTVRLRNISSSWVRLQHQDVDILARRRESPGSHGRCRRTPAAPRAPMDLLVTHENPTDCTASWGVGGRPLHVIWSGRLSLPARTVDQPGVRRKLSRRRRSRRRIRTVHPPAPRGGAHAAARGRDLLVRHEARLDRTSGSTPIDVSRAGEPRVTRIRVSINTRADPVALDGARRCRGFRSPNIHSFTFASVLRGPAFRRAQSPSGRRGLLRQRHLPARPSCAPPPRGNFFLLVGTALGRRIAPSKTVGTTFGGMCTPP
jgi:hypothetical protein